MPRPSDAEFEKLKWLLERLNDSEDFCRPYFDRAKRHYRLYRFGSAVDADDWPYVNRAQSRDILAFCEDTTALLIQTLFATTPFFSVIPRELNLLQTMFDQIDPVKIGQQIEKCLDYQVGHEDTEFFPEILDFYKGGHIFGNGYIGVYPKLDANGEFRLPKLDTIDFWDVLPIAGAKRMTKARGVFIREFKSIDELLEDQGKGFYKNVDKIRSRTSGDEENWHKALLEEIGMTNYSVSNEGDIEVIHYISGGHVITFADRRIILRDSTEPPEPTEEDLVLQDYGEPPQQTIVKPWPYNMPVVQYKYMPVPLEFFAMGIPEVLEVLQEDKNLIRSARRDNIDLVINKIIKVRQGSDTNIEMMKYYAGAVWPHENLNDSEVVEIGDVTQSSYQEEMMRTGDMENALSLFGYARGQTPQHSEQPTTVMRLQQASLNRLDLAVKLAEFTTLQNIAFRIVMLTRRFMSQGTYEAIIGEKDAGFYRLPEEIIRRCYHFKPIGSSVSNIKEVRQQQIQYAIEALMNVPPEMATLNVTPFTVDRYELLNTALDNLDIKNRERILVKLSTLIQKAGPSLEAGAQAIGGMLGQNMGGIQELASVLYGQGQQKQ
jgi:hypothetical protein